MNYLDLPLKELHEALVAKKVTPLELTEEALKRAHANKDNAFEYLDDEGAKAFAKTLVEPEKDNPLWGIPYFAKDNFSTKGIPTTASSNILTGYVPVYDATVISKLKAAKAVMIGKTTLDELAMGGTGTTGHLGKTFNPYDPKHERMIGGSSCGSAASVSASIVPFALGSDTGDSVRKPASYAGLVGMKPTWGRISRYGLFPFAPSLDHVGYFTRDVYASAVLLDVLGGSRSPRFDLFDCKPVEHYEDNLEKPVKGMKVAVLEDGHRFDQRRSDQNPFLCLFGCLEERRRSGGFCGIRAGFAGIFVCDLYRHQLRRSHK
jgi:aspartyl-tRNA(Asn)/glutamyl-tRNA(Gln) amidotransferase subunit A